VINGEFVDGDQESSKIIVPQGGRVEPRDEGSPRHVAVGKDGREVAPAAAFLRHVTAGDFGEASVRSYALALLRWLRFLWAAGVEWDRAGQGDVGGSSV
jgi:hypothetical protein